MKFLLCLALFALPFSAAPVVAQTAKRPPTTRRGVANGYHHTTNVRARPRAGAYARYDRSKRRNEEDLKLAPGLRLNMPSPPTTDYMGRPLKKKAPAATGATSLEASKKPAPPARRP